MKQERRKYSRGKSGYQIVLVSQDYQMNSGCIQNMSEGGVFVVMDSTEGFSKGMLVDAKIIGRDWDVYLPDLAMQVVRVEEDGVALRFVDPLHSDHILFGDCYSMLTDAVGL